MADGTLYEKAYVLAMLGKARDKIGLIEQLINHADSEVARKLDYPTAVFNHWTRTIIQDADDIMAVVDTLMDEVADDLVHTNYALTVKKGAPWHVDHFKWIRAAVISGGETSYYVQIKAYQANGDAALGTFYHLAAGDKVRLLNSTCDEIDAEDKGKEFTIREVSTGGSYVVFTEDYEGDPPLVPDDADDTGLQVHHTYDASDAPASGGGAPPATVDPGSFSLENAAVGDDWEGIETMVPLANAYSWLAIDVQNASTGEGAHLAGLRMLVKYHVSGSWHTCIADSEWSDENGPPSIHFCTGAIDVLAPNSSGAATIHFGARPYAVAFEARAAEGQSVDLTIRGGAWTD